MNRRGFLKSVAAVGGAAVLGNVTGIEAAPVKFKALSGRAITIISENSNLDDKVRSSEFWAQRGRDAGRRASQYPYKFTLARS